MVSLPNEPKRTPPMFETFTRYRIKKLTIVYALALTAVAILNVGAFCIVRALIEGHSHDALVINLAGRQRMLSQRIARDVLLLAREADAGKAEALEERIRSDDAELARVQRGLRYGAKELGLPGASSPVCRTMLDEADPMREALSLAVRDVLAAPRQPPSAAVGRVADVSAAYLPVMDRLVAAFQRETESRTLLLSRVETAILVSALALLAAEALLVFRPIMQRVWESHMRLRELHDKLQDEVAQRRRAVQDRERLEGLLPICASCKKIRDDRGAWHAIESYISSRTEASFTHGICPECVTKLYPDFAGRLPR